MAMVDGYVVEGHVPAAVVKKLVAEKPAIKGVSRSEEHTSELQSLMRISYAVFCLKKKLGMNNTDTITIHKHLTPGYMNQDNYKLNSKSDHHRKTTNSNE